MRQLDLDRYNRPIVELTVDGTLINLEAVRQGFAEAYRGKAPYVRLAPYLAAEEEARSAKRGIFSLEERESPRDYRRRQRSARHP